MMRIGVFCVAFAMLFASRSARAEEGMLPAGGSLKFNKIFIDEDGSRKEPSTPDKLREYLNLAHCTCSQAQAGVEQSVFYEMQLTMVQPSSAPAQLWVGTSCNVDTTRDNTCRKIDEIPDINPLATSAQQIEFGIYDVINGKEVGAGVGCKSREGEAIVWALVDTNGDGSFEYINSQAVGKSSTDATLTGVDTQPPPSPTEFEGASAEGAIRLSWTGPVDRPLDVKYYQAFCMDSSGAPVLSDPPKPHFQTVTSLCGLASDEVIINPVDITTGDGIAATVPSEFSNLDPAYICGESSEQTATGMLISGLTNNEPYRVMVVSIDPAGNATGNFLTSTITPHAVTDFWEDIHDRGSDVEGGFCLLAETYGDGGPITQALRAFRDDTLGGSGFGRALTSAYYATMAKLGAFVHGSLALRAVAAIVLLPLVAIALLWHLLTLPGLLLLIAVMVLWRKKRMTPRMLARLAPAAALAVILLAPSASHAQGPSPYWDGENNHDAGDVDDPTDVTWHAGIRVGPYVPDIDSQLGGTSPGPYKEMFGGYRVIPMLDVDRFLWTGFGQFGIGGSIGYMQKTAHAWIEGSTPGDPDRMRSSGDENTFRLIPLALTATYRFTWLDDEYGIPVVPYVRGGLAYYIWSMRTNGKTSEACWDGTHTQNCDADKGYGGSLGVVGSIGLAIRAERIDSSAASSMRQSGIMHAGFYGELSLAKVDGFGSATKLSVGDRTWFAGVDFEF